MKCYANAKINLALNVLTKRDDGYHELDMVMVPIDLYDTIYIDVLDNAEGSHVEFDDYSIPENNTVTKAIKVMRNHFHFKQHFDIYIKKRIPSQAGLGGGSADAAMVMQAIKELLNISCTHEKLLSLAKEIGADVPFFLINKPARVQGIGEIVTPFVMKDKLPMILIKPFKGCDTKKVYQNYDEHPCLTHLEIMPAITKLEKGQYDDIEKELQNELFEGANKECGDIGRIVKQLHDDGFSWVGMTGSGSMVYAIEKDEQKLLKAKKKYQKKGYYVVLSAII